jgi:hypothetical protein
VTILDYLMHQNQGSWQISDVYLGGTISQFGVPLDPQARGGRRSENGIEP